MSEQVPPRPHHAPSASKGPLLERPAPARHPKAVLAVATGAALLAGFGIGFGSGGAAERANTELCIEALDEAELVFGIMGDAKDHVVDAFDAASRWNSYGIESGTTNLGRENERLELAGATFCQARDECLDAGS